MPALQCDLRWLGGGCGDDLQAALNGVAPTLFVCPGTYQGGFLIERDVTVIGTGEGEDPASSTILDGNETQGVLQITSGTVDLRRLRIAHGNAGAGFGGGIWNTGATSLNLQDCTVANNSGRNGGGIAHNSGSLAMTRCTVQDNVAPRVGSGGAQGDGLRVIRQANLTDCLVSGNTSDDSGGGIYAHILVVPLLTLAGTTRIERNAAGIGGGIFVDQFTSVTIGNACRITGNTATLGSGRGGGIYNNTSSGTVTLEGDVDPSPIVTGNCAENCAGTPVPKCQPGGVCPAVP